jgi:hypothetical protein
MHTLRAQREADLKALVPPVQVPSSPYSQSSGGASGNSSASVTPTKMGGSGSGYGWGMGPSGMESHTIYENVVPKLGQIGGGGGGGVYVDSDDENENRVQNVNQNEEESELKEDPVTVTTVTMSLDSQFSNALSDGTSPSTITPSIASDGSRTYPPSTTLPGAAGPRSAQHTHTRPADLRVVTGNGSSGSLTGTGGSGGGEGGRKVDHNPVLLTPRGNTVSPMDLTVTPLSFGADRLKSLEALSVSTPSPVRFFESLMAYLIFIFLSLDFIYQ